MVTGESSGPGVRLLQSLFSPGSTKSPAWSGFVTQVCSSLGLWGQVDASL